jgi:glyoxylase-like metal-dependent hydrolase (beta-lactamase superfamily II)
MRLGEVTIERVVEIGRSTFPTTMMLPDATPEAIARHHHWLKPDFFDETVGDLGSRIQSFVVRTPEHTILIDTGVGNGKARPTNPVWNMRSGTYLDDLAAVGVKPEDVDYVICTHLHVDHVGWNTRFVNGRWTPTFPRATYVMAGEEWEYWRSEQAADEFGCIDDSVLPIVEAGRTKLVDPDFTLGRHLKFEPSRGHTPGHVCVRLTTSAGEAVFSGDLMHRTVQVAEPQWSSRFCQDPAQARVTRRAFIERFADSGVLVIAAHFPCAGHIVRADGSHRFVPARL